MATLITGTVLFSLLYSLFFFMPLLSLMGPQGDCGRLRAFWTKEQTPADVEEVKPNKSAVAEGDL